MKKLSLFCMAVFTASAVFAEANPNPALKLFDENVRFYLSFDNANCNADMAEGKGEPTKLSKGAKAPEFTDGLFGKALKKGNAVYSANLNLDLSAPGSLILWAAPTWEQTKPANGKEPGFSIFSAFAKAEKYNYSFILGKTWNQPWGHGHINAYVQYIPAKQFKHVNNMVYDMGRTSKWKANEWRMFVVTWSPGSFSNSVNGRKSKVAQLKNLMTGKTQNFNIGISGKIIVDEVVILNRALSDEEISNLYNETQKLIKQAAK